ncbi:MAG: hypothetical protein ACI892_001557, partial [Marinobacter maritimus]
YYQKRDQFDSSRNLIRLNITDDFLVRITPSPDPELLSAWLVNRPKRTAFG